MFEDTSTYNLFTSLPSGPVCQSGCMVARLLVCPFICVSVHLTDWLPAYLSACLPHCLSVYVLVCHNVCLPSCLSLCLSVCLSACPSVYLSVCMCVGGLCRDRLGWPFVVRVGFSRLSASISTPTSLTVCRQPPPPVS